MKNLRFKSFYFLAVVFALIGGSFSLSFLTAEASIIDTLKNSILGRQNDIEEIDREIQQLESHVHETRQERLSLEEVVNELSSQQQALQRQINSAQSNISEIEDTINSIDEEVSVLEVKIDNNLKVLAGNIRRLNMLDTESVVLALLRHNSLAEYWIEADVTDQMNSALNESMQGIRDNQRTLMLTREQQTLRRAEIITLQNEIRTNKISIDLAREHQDNLLAATQSEENSYQAILNQKREEREAFERDLATYAAQLNLAINPQDIPVADSTALSYPVDDVRITQYFGNTAFAMSGAYNGSGHNGVDFGVPVGTPLKAARQGVVRALGDTDEQCRYASYGKWILVDHDNGLSTLYAHLSSFAASPGQTVARGQVIGYSGNTGYSTGPHLHFTVFATEGMRVDYMPSRSCPGSSFYLPLADLAAYLNPMEYLP